MRVAAVVNGDKDRAMQRTSVERVTIVHEIDVRDSKLIEGVSGGWPMILASLKSLLETGTPIEETGHWPKDM